MTTLDRREFLNQSKNAGLGAAVGASVLARASRARAATANDKIIVAIVGIRGRGSGLAQGFAERDDCEVAYLADVDTSLFDSRVAQVASAQGKAPQTVRDFRRVLDDQSVDAIVVATPDHWHALATVWGCQAGKDVYVEKPASHSAWEGRQMVAAARRHKRIVQLGTQNRSAPYNWAAKQYIDSGKLGAIHMVRVYNQKQWGNRQAVPDSAAPGTLDWDMWSGPAEKTPYNANYHGAWNHFWRYSGGDIINDGVHQLDLARWLIGKDYPQSVYSVGGRFAEEGVLESPDTQVAVYEYDDMVMTFEMTLYTPYMYKTDPEVRNSDMFPYWPQNATRIEIYGSDGLMVVGRHGGGWQVFTNTHGREPVVKQQMYGRFPDVEHKQNFVDCIRSRQLPHADIEQGHRSTLLCHWANISYRTGGQKLLVDPATETFTNSDAANALLKRDYRSPWVVPEVV